MSQKEYLISDFKLEYINGGPDINTDNVPIQYAGKNPIAYGIITKEFEEKLDSMPEKGNALFANRIIMSHDEFIVKVNRVNNIVTLALNKLNTIRSGNEALDAVYSYMDWIYNTMHEHDAKKPGKFIPIYTAGIKFRPDESFDMYDTGITITQKSISYGVIFNKKSYDAYIKPFKKQYEKMITSIMKADGYGFHDDLNTVMITDKNDGNGPDYDKADAYTRVMQLNLNGIRNALRIMG